MKLTQRSILRLWLKVIKYKTFLRQNPSPPKVIMYSSTQLTYIRNKRFWLKMIDTLQFKFFDRSIPNSNSNTVFIVWVIKKFRIFRAVNFHNSLPFQCKPKYPYMLWLFFLNSFIHFRFLELIWSHAINLVNDGNVFRLNSFTFPGK